MIKFKKIFLVLVGFPEISTKVCKNASMQVFWVETFLNQILPGPNFFKPSVLGGLRIFRAFASLFELPDPWLVHACLGILKHVEIKPSLSSHGCCVWLCVFVFVCLHACRQKCVCVCAYQSMFEHGCQKATNIKLLDHNFSSPTRHNAKEYAQGWRHSSLSSSRIMIMSLASLHFSYSVFSQSNWMLNPLTRSLELCVLTRRSSRLNHCTVDHSYVTITALLAV